MASLVLPGTQDSRGSTVLQAILDFQERVDTAASAVLLGTQVSAERTVKAATLASVGLVLLGTQASVVRPVTLGQMALR
jgi:hypothetical protein